MKKVVLFFHADKGAERMIPLPDFTAGKQATLIHSWVTMEGYGRLDHKKVPIHNIRTSEPGDVWAHVSAAIQVDPSDILIVVARSDDITKTLDELPSRYVWEWEKRKKSSHPHIDIYDVSAT